MDCSVPGLPVHHQLPKHLAYWCVVRAVSSQIRGLLCCFASEAWTRLLLFNFLNSIPPQLVEGQGLCSPFFSCHLLTLGGVNPSLRLRSTCLGTPGLSCRLCGPPRNSGLVNLLAGTTAVFCAPQQGTGEVWIPLHPPTARGEPTGGQGTTSPSTFLVFSNSSVPHAIQLSIQ